MSLEDTTLNNEEQTRAIKNIKRAAEFNDKNIFIQTKQNNLPVREATLKILNDIESFFSNYAHHNISEIIEYQKDKVLYPQKRYAEIIKNKYGNNYVEKGLALTKEYADKI